jgi:hypothetical protein
MMLASIEVGGLDGNNCTGRWPLFLDLARELAAAALLELAIDLDGNRMGRLHWALAFDSILRKLGLGLDLIFAIAEDRLGANIGQ